MPTGAGYYIYDDQGQLLGEYDASGNPIYETIYLGSTPVGAMKQGTLYNVYADQIDTPRMITQQDHQIVWRWDTAEAFGATAPNQDPSGLGAFVFNQRFPGQAFDAETGLNQNTNREYDPRTGRYRQFDPLGLAPGINGYLYGKANPLSLTDPLGLATAAEVSAALQTLRGAYPSEFSRMPSSVSMSAIDGLGMTDWANNIQLSAERFGDSNTCVRPGDEYQFLQTLAHELLHVNENIALRLLSNSFRMGNPLGYFHRKLDDKADVLITQKLIDQYLKARGDCTCKK